MKLLVLGGEDSARRAVVERLVSAAHSVHELPGGDAPADVLATSLADVDGAVLLGRLGRARVADIVRPAAARQVKHLVLVARRGDPESRAEEEELARFEGRRTVLRVPHLYGPGDPVYGALVTMMRSLPMLPVPDTGGQRLQPLAHRDLAEAIARVTAGVAEGDRVLELAGPDVTSLGDLLDRLEHILGKGPMRFPVPDAVLAAGMQLASSFGFEVTEGENPLVALGGEDALPAGVDNALVDVLSVEPTPLDEGLRQVVEHLPEQLPEDGVGPLMRRRWWTSIQNSTLDADELFAWFRDHFAECMAAAGVEPGARPPDAGRLIPGNTIGFELPLRGHVEVRVIEVTDRRATIATVQGHPLAAAIMFGISEFGTGLRFEVSSLERAGSVLDQLALAAGGSALQEMTMDSLVTCVVRASGGEAAESVQYEEVELEGAAALDAEAEIEALVRRADR